MRSIACVLPLWFTVGCTISIAQTVPPPFTCSPITTTVTPTVRTEGITELVGDLLLQCTGGRPTPLGQPIPGSHIRLTLNTNVTSRLLAGSASNPNGFIDALLLIDDPYPTASQQVPSTVNPPPGSPPQLFCPYISGCPGTGAPTGQSPYQTGGAPTIYVAHQPAANAVEWDGVPIDPPGTTGIRRVRITNVRANASQLGLSSTLIPTQIVGFVGVTGGQFFTINNPQQTLAFISQGLLTSTPSVTSAANLPHCLTHYTPLPPNPTPDAVINITGDNNIFRRRSYLPNGNPTQPPAPQNVPGFFYNSESDFIFNIPNPPVQVLPGLADHGVRFEAIFNNIPKGVTLFVPTVSTTGGNQVTITSDPIGPFAPVTAPNGMLQVPVQQGVGSVTFEVTGNAATGPFNVNVPMFTSFTSNGQISGSPTPGPITFEISPQPSAAPPPNVQPSLNPVPQFFDSSLSLINQGTQNVDAGQIAVGTILSCFSTPPAFQLGPPFNNGNPVAFTALPDGQIAGSQNVVVYSDTQALQNVNFQVSASPTPKAVPSGESAHAIEQPATAASASSAWLTVTLSSTSTPITAKLQANPAGLAPGTYSGSVTFTSSQASSSQVLPVSLTVMPPGPALSRTAVFNAASYAPMAVAPGENIVIYGSQFGPSNLATATLDAQGRLATSLAEVSVLFDNVPAPLVYAGKGVVSALVPFAVANESLTAMQVVYQGMKSAPYVLPVYDAIPGLYTASGGGGGQGAILNQDNSYNSASIPANPGDIIQLFGTGAGQTSPGGTDGNPAQSPFPKPLLPISVTIDGLAADVIYAASAPGEPEGVFQVNAKVPAGVTRGASVPVLVMVGTKQTQPGVTVAISAAK